MNGGPILTSGGSEGSQRDSREEIAAGYVRGSGKNERGFENLSPDHTLKGCSRIPQSTEVNGPELRGPGNPLQIQNSGAPRSPG